MRLPRVSQESATLRLMSQPTYDDVNLLLRLYEMRREAKLREARAWFFANFKAKTLAEMQKLAPPGSDANAYYRQFISYWDMVASFVNMGVLNADLCFANSREMLVAWLRISPFLDEARAAFKDRGYLGNLEQCGKAYADWVVKTSGQEAYDGFVARISG